MEKLLAPDTFGIIIQSISAIVIAVITYVLGPSIVRRSGAQESNHQPLIYFIVGGVAAALTFIVIGLAFTMLTPKPKITIAIPATGQQIEIRLSETGSGSFTVSGTSSKVYSDPNIRIYVLIHPNDPPAAGWWIQQPAIVERNGQWQALIWTGSKDFPPHIGDKFEVVAVLAKPEQVASVEKVIDPKDIRPVAQSDIVEISIGATR